VVSEPGAETMSSHSRCRVNTELLAASLLLAGSAAAAAPATAPLEEIIVTATRRAASLLDYPGAASVVGEEAVRLVGATHHAEIMNRVPGVMIQRNSGEESLTAVRSPVLAGPGSCGEFLFLEDGVPIRPVGFCNVNELFEVDTEQARAIEILRGPATALYGSSGMHGTINVLTPDPQSLPAFGAGLELGPASYVRGRIAASHEGERTGVGLAALATHDGGWRDDSGFDEQKLNAVLQHHAAGVDSDVRLTATNLNQDTAGFIVGEDAYKHPDIAKSNANPEAFRDAYAVRLRARFSHANERGARWTALPYLRTSHMRFLQHFLLGKPLEENGQDSLGVQLSYAGADDGRTRWLTGVDLEVAQSFLRERQDGPVTNASPAAIAIRPPGLHYDYEVDAGLAAAWAHLEQALGGRYTATLGARLEHVRYQYDNRLLAGNTDENGVPCDFGGCLFNRPADRTDSYTNFAPKLGLTLSVGPDTRFYAAATRGFRAPETAELYRLQRQQNVANLDSERIDSFELGVHGLNGGLRYSFAAFTMVKDNVILRDSEGFNVDNGRTRHRGFEYELTWRALDTLTLTGAGTWARHTYDFNGTEGSEEIVSGRDIDTAPRDLHTVRANWSAAPQLDLELEWQHIGAYWLDAANAHRYPGHDLLCLRAAWSPGNDWTLYARVNNVTDEAYADRADYAFGNYRYFPGRERSVFVGVDFSLK
jgi:iron complex outermembrane recepter protein